MGKNDITIHGLINQIYDNFLIKDAYLLYIEFCFEVIKKIDDKLTEDLKEIVQLEKKFWFEDSVQAQELVNARVKILKKLDESDRSLDLDFETETKLAILPLWTDPPSDDIGDSFEWSMLLLEELKISEQEIFEILLPIFNKFNQGSNH